MKTPIHILWLAILLGVVLAQSAIAQEKHIGRVVFAADTKLVISDVDDSSEMFVVPDDAKITRDGKVASLSDLAMGDAVVVTAVRNDADLVASVIAATSGR